ncbi:MAG: pyridoxamine kinase [Butyrivibrio sp.]|nr:pyridoxamine kinase [Butyrivibrio sp.]
MKRVLTVQDISCIGRCSLTVALPIISAMGIETAVLPTAVLSNHTAFENGFTFRDLTDDLDGILAHWKKDNFKFDAIYTGYLGSIKQISIVETIFKDFADKNQLKIVDPAMADGGKLYKGFDDEYAREMASLCASADIILPNLTEVCILTSTPYREDFTKDEIKAMLKKLSDAGTPLVIMTGATEGKDKLGVLSYRKTDDSWHEYYGERMEHFFHGTGDVFASCLTGAFTRGADIDTAIKIAVEFVVDSIKKTEADEDRVWYGVNFEQAIPKLISMLGILK